MSTILYNTSSSLVPKFQRHSLLRQQREASRGSNSATQDEGDGRTSAGECEDTPFESSQDKNSDGYLRELCCSVYPVSLHQRIAIIDPLVDLPLQALMSLLWQNFVTPWYGVKIQTCDDRFMGLLFDVVQAIAARLKSTDLDWESFIGDDLPGILSEHILAMRVCLQEDDVFSRYCQLTCVKDGYYPQLLTNCLLASVPGGSGLQSIFLQALFNELLMGKVMDRVSEPYFALSAISKVCRRLEMRRQQRSKQAKVGPVERCKRWIAIAGKTIALMTSLNKPSARSAQLPIAYMNVFTFAFVDLLKLPSRKPFLYAMGKALQHWSSKSKSVHAILQNLFFNVVERCAWGERGTRHLFLLVREVLFPRDHKMGRGSVIPEGEEFESFKLSCVEDLWRTVCAYKLDSAFGLEHLDVTEIVEIISRDKRCNKILFFKIIDSLLAHTERLPL